jgi:Divergent InlB B-repeat domain
MLGAGPLLFAFVAVALLGSGAGSASAGLTRLSTITSPTGEARGETRARLAGAAAWCGSPSATDRAPNPVAGNPIHWIYVVPSDGPDQLSTIAALMQADAEAIDAWWKSQDPTRSPRSDLASFACGLQLDVSSVRLSQSAAQLTARATPFDEIWDALVARSFGSAHAKYVIYYDGPVSNNRICGAGGTLPSQLGMAMIFIRSCTGISTAEVAAHELLHAIGAVPRGAPRMCPPPDEGHTCDTSADIMYPYTDGGPLSALVLDPGRDDYYGHSGSWTDIQDSPWLVQHDRQTRFTVTVAGPGRVVADLPGLDCNRTCATTWNAGTRLDLTAIPEPGAKLVRWSEDCSGASRCLATAGGGGSAVSALFAPTTYSLDVRVSGRGTVRSSRPGIVCPRRCSSSFSSYDPLRLQAIPAKGWKLVRWTGACRGKARTCTLPMASSSSVRAVFARS